MDKAQLAAEVARRMEMRTDDVLPLVDALMRTIARTLGEGGRVHLRGFGEFHVKHYAKRNIRNFQGKQVRLKPRHIPAFRPHADLRRYIEVQRLK